MTKGYRTEKDIKKSLNQAKAERATRKRQNRKEREALSLTDTLKLEISELESRKHVVEHDLNGMFKGHSGIQNKLNLILENINQKKKELEDEENKKNSNN